MKGLPIKSLSPKDRILTNIVVDENGCWVWQRAIETGGRGVLNIRDDGEHKMVRAHRYSYEVFVGPIPEGLTIDHLCRNIKCVNYEHLEPVSIQVNIKRHWAALGFDERCGKGHERTEETTAYSTRKDGKLTRRCRICDREYSRSYQKRKKTT